MLPVELEEEVYGPSRQRNDQMLIIKKAAPEQDDYVLILTLLFLYRLTLATWSVNS